MLDTLMKKIRPQATSGPCTNCGSKSYERTKEGWRCSECKRPKVTAIDRMEGK